MGQEEKEESPTELHAHADQPSGVGKSSAEGGSRKPVFVCERKELGDLEQGRGKQVEREDVATRKKFEGVDQKDQRTDVEEPEGG